MVYHSNRKNNKLSEELKIEIESLINKINLIKEKIDINNSLNNELEIKISSNIEQANKKLDDLIRLLNNSSTASDNYSKTLKRLELGLNEISNVLTKTNRMSNFVMLLDI